jgi:peptidoglycan/xylan/chitin deacetylase (PgdA/CDA1 family)
MILRSVFNRLSPAGESARLSILIFHRVLPVADPLFPSEIDAARFEDICRWVSRWFNVLPLSLAAQLLADGRLPARPLVITFDDGYADNHQIALPILQRHGLTASFFVATGFLDGGRMWNDTLIEAIRLTPATRWDLSGLGLAGLGPLPLAGAAERRAAIKTVIDACKYLAAPARAQAVAEIAKMAHVALPTNLMMRSEQVAQLHAAGMEVGAHTANHPILASLPIEQARDEIVVGKQRLEEIVQAPVTTFAYPNGRPGQDYQAEHVELAKALGFVTAVSTSWGAASTHTDTFQLPRFTPWDRQRWAFALRMARNLRGPSGPHRRDETTARALN